MSAARRFPSSLSIQNELTARATASDVVAALRSLVLDGGTEVPVLDVGDATSEFTELAATILAIRGCAHEMAAGSFEGPVGAIGPIADSLRTLRSNLARVTRQARQIANGDLTQRAESLGEFSAAFNAMTERMVEDRENMRQRESELQLASLAAEHAALAMTIFDRTGRYMHANQQACELMGYTSDEILDLQVWDVAPEFTPELLEASWAQFSPVGEMHVETMLRRKDGTLLPIDVAIARLPMNGQHVAVAFSMDITERKAAEERSAAMVARLESLMEQSVRTIALIVETRDPYTAGHQRRVSELAVAIAAEMELDEHRTAGLSVAGQLHDVGKTAVPSEILSKPGALSEMEFNIVKEHARAGHAILAEIDFPWPVAEIVWQHHERLDGSGYPRGLVGDDIMLEARILAVADVVEAMSAHRPYRAALGVDAAIAEIEHGSNVLYDADVVAACAHLFREGDFTFS
jgi:PAS domain S-box-containing protein/putative nucleotidyltransferase with HDIG domain